MQKRMLEFERDTLTLSKPILEDIENLTFELEKLRITKGAINICSEEGES
jgi:hypothetical protein